MFTIVGYYRNYKKMLFFLYVFFFSGSLTLIRRGCSTVSADNTVSCSSDKKLYELVNQHLTRGFLVTPQKGNTCLCYSHTCNGGHWDDIFEKSTTVHNFLRSTLSNLSHHTTTDNRPDKSLTTHVNVHVTKPTDTVITKNGCAALATNIYILFIIMIIHSFYKYYF